MSAGAISSATVFRSLGGSLSGPHALAGFNKASCFATPSVPMVMFGIGGYTDVPLSGMSLSFSWVKTNLKCALSASALSRSVVHNFVAVLNVGIPRFSVRMSLTYDQKHLGFSVRLVPIMLLT